MKFNAMHGMRERERERERDEGSGGGRVKTSLQAESPPKTSHNNIILGSFYVY